MKHLKRNFVAVRFDDNDLARTQQLEQAWGLNRSEVFRHAIILAHRTQFQAKVGP